MLLTSDVVQLLCLKVAAPQLVRLQQLWGKGYLRVLALGFSIELKLRIGAGPGAVSKRQSDQAGHGPRREAACSLLFASPLHGYGHCSFRLFSGIPQALPEVPPRQD